MIDWSANSSPKQGKDSIWVAVADRSGEVVFVDNPRTREEMASVLDEILTDQSFRLALGWTRHEREFPCPAPGPAQVSGLGQRPKLADWGSGPS